MLRLISRRLLYTIPLLFVVTAVTFVVSGLTPGDPGRRLLGVNATPEAVAAFDRRLGLDKPLYVQYAHWLGHALKGDLGVSAFTNESVASILAAGLPVTLSIVIGSVALSMIVGIPLGVSAATRRGALSRAVDLLSILGYAIPAFWLGYLLVALFNQSWNILPAAGWVSPGTSVVGWLKSLVLPVVTLSAHGIGMIARQARDRMISVLSEPYIRALRSRGMSERRIVYKHALRRALPVVLTQTGMFVVGLTLGTSLAESVFALQGLGSIAIEATNDHNIPILQGVALYFALMIVIVFFIIELVNAWLEPRIRRHAR